MISKIGQMGEIDRKITCIKKYRDYTAIGAHRLE